jgi:hypothetical protein
MMNFESWMLNYLLNSLWQVPLLFAAGWVVARVARTIGVGPEHRVWVGVLILQSLLPAGSALPLEWLRRALDWTSEAHRGGEPHVSVTMGAGSLFGGFQMPSELFGVIATAFGLISVYFFLRFAWRCRRLAFLSRGTVQAVFPVEVADFWLRCSKECGIDEVSLATSTEIFGPVTLGILRPLVLLPLNLVDGMSTADLHTVIAHEFAHIRRNDFFKNLVYELLALPVSYHPLFSLTRERLMESREMVCDEMAATISGRDAYAHSLLRLASLLIKGKPVRIPHAIGIFDANTLERRLMRLTERRNWMETSGDCGGMCAFGRRDLRFGPGAGDACGCRRNGRGWKRGQESRANRGFCEGDGGSAADQSPANVPCRSQEGENSGQGRAERGGR